MVTLRITRPGTYLIHATSQNAPAETDIAIGQSLTTDSNGVPASSWILMLTGLGSVFAFFILHAWWGRLHAWWHRPR